MTALSKIGATIGSAASVVSVIAFISVKPLPKIEFSGGIDWCGWSDESRQLSQQLADAQGQIVMVDFNIVGDIQRMC